MARRSFCRVLQAHARIRKEQQTSTPLERPPPGCQGSSRPLRCCASSADVEGHGGLSWRRTCCASMGQCSSGEESGEAEFGELE